MKANTKQPPGATPTHPNVLSPPTVDQHETQIVQDSACQALGVTTGLRRGKGKGGRGGC